MGGGSRMVGLGGGGGALGGAIWVEWGHMPPRPSVGQSQAPLTSPCPPSTACLKITIGKNYKR